ncbi:MAG: type II toxin-antitoxin system mRNA interferase toxin, RelE/StbE family [Anaerolineae bacterium]|nr:MAG: type II toxin-antitoxin system mRNA interferase toxin, RelE/StbE family [Anaerolineae bacterium]
MYTLIWTPRFTRSAERFAKQHPELRASFAAVLRVLEQDPFQPHLKFHNLGGKLRGIQAVSLTHDYRITLTVFITEREITLLDIGSHGEVYR